MRDGFKNYQFPLPHNLKITQEAYFDPSLGMLGQKGLAIMIISLAWSMIHRITSWACEVGDTMA